MTGDEVRDDFDEDVPSAAALHGRGRRWSAVIGAGIGFAGLGFVVATLYGDREQISVALEQARPILLIVAFALQLAAMVGIGLGWRAAVVVLGGQIGIASSLRGYFVGQLGKYVPGGVWAVVGRAEWARSEGVAAGVAYSSVALSIGTAFLAAVMFAALALPAAGLGGFGGNTRYFAVFALLPLGFILLNPWVLSTLLSWLRRLTKRSMDIEVPSWKASSLIVVRQLPSWALIGGASWLIAQAFGSSGNLANVAFAASIAWVVGFLALPVPGGIGVREAVFVALATSLPPGVAAIVALTARLGTILVDTAGAASMTIWVRRR